MSSFQELLRKVLGNLPPKFFTDLPPSHYELEIRFQSYSKHRFTSFQRVKSHYIDQSPSEAITSQIVDRSKGSKKKQLEDVANDDGATIERTIDGVTTWLQKRSEIDSSKVNGGSALRNSYGVIIEISAETPLAAITKFEPDTIRKKKRYSIILGKNKQVRLDLTEVEGERDEKKDELPRTNYEVELEYLGQGGLDSLDEYALVANELFLVMHGTEHDYSLDLFRSTLLTINNLLGSTESLMNKQQTVEKSLVFQLRDLTFEDLTGAGLNSDEYQMSFKTDGTRRLLFLTHSGLWLIMQSELNLIYPLPFGDSGRHYLFDGELLLKAKNELTDAYPKSSLYLIYDTLWFDAADVRSDPHPKRLDFAKQLLLGSEIDKSLFKELEKAQQGFPLRVKDYYPFRSGKDHGSDTLFALVARLEQQKAALDYKEDGYVFIPIKMAYNDVIDKCDPKERRWLNHPDGCKWKRNQDLTIDLQLFLKSSAKKGRYTYELYLGNNKEKLITTYLSDRSYAEGTVAEFEVIEAGYKLRKVRPDKLVPNSVKTGNEIMKRQKDPIELEVLLGKGLRLQRKYHNRVKRDLYQVAPGGTLLDLGSGPGGDYEKWRTRYHKIVLVEPSLDFIAEMATRHKIVYSLVTTLDDIDEIDPKKAVVVINSGAEHTDLITKTVQKFIGGPVDTVSSQFSMSFLWKDKEMVAKFKRTVANNLAVTGEFIFSTIDGYAVKKLLGDNGEVTTEDYRIVKRGHQVTITLAGSKTVKGAQEEYLVDITDLYDLKIGGVAFTPLTIELLDGEKLLPQAAITLSRLYISGRMTLSSIAPIQSPNQPIGPNRPPLLRPLVTLSDREGVTKKWDWGFRLGVPPHSGGHEGYYAALLTILSPNYRKLPLNDREIELSKFENELGPIAYQLNQSLLRVGIWMIALNTGDGQAKVIHQGDELLPYQVVLLKIAYKGQDYYEPVGVGEREANGTRLLYRFLYPKSDPIIEQLRRLTGILPPPSQNVLVPLTMTPTTLKFKFQDGADQLLLPFDDRSPEGWLFKEGGPPGPPTASPVELLKLDLNSYATYLGEGELKGVRRVMAGTLPVDLALVVKLVGNNERELIRNLLFDLIVALNWLKVGGSLVLVVGGVSSYTTVSLIYLMLTIFKSAIGINDNGNRYLLFRGKLEDRVETVIKILNRADNDARDRIKLSLVPLKYLKDDPILLRSIRSLL